MKTTGDQRFSDIFRGCMGQGIHKGIKKNFWKTAFEVIWWSAYFKIFKGCLPQILLGPFLNTLTQI